MAKCRCREFSPAPLEEQPLLSTAELFFQSTAYYCLHLCHACMHVPVCVFSKVMLTLVVSQSAGLALLDHLRMVLSISSLFGTPARLIPSAVQCSNWLRDVMYPSNHISSKWLSKFRSMFVFVSCFAFLSVIWR